MAASRADCGGRICLIATAGRTEKSDDGSATAATGDAVFAGGRIASAASAANAGFFLGSPRDFGDYFAGFRIVFTNGVLANVNETFTIDGHAVALRGIEGANDVAGFIEVDHGRWVDAAIGDGRG